MSNTYSWKINALKCVQDPQPDYVSVVEWTATGTNGAHTAVIHGTSSFNPNNSSSGENPYCPYAELTEETVLGWIKDSESVTDIEATLDNQLLNLQSPPAAPKAVDLPWVNN